MQLKQILSLLLCFIICAFLIACDNEAENTSEQENTNITTTEKASSPTTEDSEKTKDSDNAPNLSEYKIMSATDQALVYISAGDLADYFKKYAKTDVEIIGFDTGYDGPAIVFGAKDRSGSTDASLDDTFSIKRDNFDIIINCDERTCSLAEEEIERQMKKSNYEISVVSDFESNVMDFLDNKLTEKSANTSTVTDGITRTDYEYDSADGEVTEAYKIEVAPGSATAFVGAANDKNDAMGKQNVIDQANLYKDMGKDVICAINAGFFGDGGEPCGVLIKNGEKLHNTRGFCFFGVLKTGEYLCGDEAKFKKHKYDEYEFACGASQWILSEGNFNPFDNVKTMSMHHPRSSVGLKEDGTLVILAVDGRQQNMSTGITLYDLALLMKSYGCVEAVNLDGGGSTQLIVKNSDNGELEVINSPCEIPFRAVSDTIIVAK